MTLSTGSSRIWLSSADPTATEENIDQGNFWFNTNTEMLYICTDNTPSSEIWMMIESCESNTFTPVIEGATTAGSGTYSIQLGQYCKAPRQMDVDINITWSAHTGTGDMIITGLPVAANAAITSIGFCHAQNIPLATGAIGMVAKASGTSLVLVSSVANGNEAPIAMSSSGSIMLSMRYCV